MRKAVILAVLLFGIVGTAVAAGPVRLDLAALAVTDGPAGPGLSLGADIPFGDWAYGLRAAHISDNDAEATSLTLGLEYGFGYGKVVPYLGARAGARWTSEDVTICVQPPKKLFAWKAPAPVCSDEEEEENGLLYQGVFGVDVNPRGLFGATAEVAVNGGEGEGVEFLVGVTIRP